MRPLTYALRRTLGLALFLFAVPAFAQGDGAGVDGVVKTDSITTFRMAVPKAFNQGGAADTIGVTEALTGTISRDLTITGYFELIKPAAFLPSASKEGMTPDMNGWFTVGTQGLIKAGYKIVGKQVTLDLRLFSVDGGRQIPLKGFGAPTTVPLKTKALRKRAHEFVNEVIRYYTKSPGFFGTRIVLVKRTGKGKSLYMISADGREETRLTSDGSINMLPSFRGGKIFFTSFRAGGPHLYSLSGGSAKPFAAYKGLNTGGVLSPAGNAVAATLSKDGNPEIYTLNPGTGQPMKRLTNSWGIDTSATWSPDASQIAFVSDRHGSPQIWVMTSGGGGARRLTFQGDYNTTPEWSPRGDKIVFTARDERNVFDIFTVRVADGVIERVTQNQGNNEEPTWSPDGRHIAFTSTRTGGSQVYISTEDGRIQTQVTRGKGGYTTPFWEK
ncbi:MAG: TolB protein [Bradymonadia bacterium]|jgi:TolB protein